MYNPICSLVRGILKNKKTYKYIEISYLKSGCEIEK